MKLDVYGKRVDLDNAHGRWHVFYVGHEGKKRRATDIHIPDNVRAHEVMQFIADLCHEWATPRNSTVRLIDE